MKDQDRIDLIKDEIQIYRKVHHKNVVKLFDVFEDHLAIILLFEHVDGPTLERTYQMMMKYFSKELVYFIYECLQTLGEIHSNKIVHRNINPITLMLRNPGKPGAMNPPLFMGFSKSMQLNKFGCVKAYNIQCRRLGFIAPELLSSDLKSFNINLYKSDVFSLGRTMYC